MPSLKQPIKNVLQTVLNLSKDESAALRDLDAQVLKFARGDVVLGQGTPHEGILVVERGWCSISRFIEDGRRQILQFAIPGDFLCVDAVVSAESKSELVALTDVRVLRVTAGELLQLASRHPRIGLALVWCAARDESMLAERLVSVGRRSAYERLAHFFVEIWRRSDEFDMTEGGRCILPATKEQLADAMGLTSIHIYRTLRRLERDGLVRLEKNFFEIGDMDRLEEAAKYDTSYVTGAELPSKSMAAINGARP